MKYKCDGCGEEYDTERECDACENSHKKRGYYLSLYVPSPEEGGGRPKFRRMGVDEHPMGRKYHADSDYREYYLCDHDDGGYTLCTYVLSREEARRARRTLCEEAFNLLSVRQGRAQQLIETICSIKKSLVEQGNLIEKEEQK